MNSQLLIRPSSDIAGNVHGLPQHGLTLNGAAVNWLTFFLQANLRQTGQINKWTIPGARVVASLYVKASSPPGTAVTSMKRRCNEVHCIN